MPAPDPGDGALPAVAGYPYMAVPMGQVYGLPVGLSFIGSKWFRGGRGDGFDQVVQGKPPSIRQRTVDVARLEQQHIDSSCKCISESGWPVTQSTSRKGSQSPARGDHPTRARGALATHR